MWFDVARGPCLGEMGVVGEAIEGAKEQVETDLRADPYLRWILLLALALAGFWIWHGLPNFATRDERWRIVDPIEAVGFVVDDPGLGSLREGVAFWRSYGAAFYLFGITAVPVVTALFLRGEQGVLVDIAAHQPWGYWAYWNRTPGWVWTGLVLAGRLANVAFAVGSVYVLYRIGTTVRGRPTGRLAALLLSLTWGFLVLAHEAGEDVPALFFFLLSVYLALGYVETGSARRFYAASAAGGIAIAFKLTAGVSAVLIGVAYLMRARRGEGLRESIARDRGRLLRVGAAIGICVIVVGYPTNLVAAPGEFLVRVGRGVANKGRPHRLVRAPSWWWILRGYLHGFGLPLFVGVLGGVTASLARIRDDAPATDGVRLALVGVGGYLLAVAPWSYVRTHHLLPTFPLLLLVLSVSVARLRERRPTVARLVVAALVVTAGAYAGAGDLGYASEPRDEATAWLATHAGANATVETYINDPQDAAVPHGASVSHIVDRRMVIDGETRRPGVGIWMLAVSERCPEYVQLNFQGAVRYLAPADYSDRFRYPNNPRLREHFRGLLAGNGSYVVAAEFGPRPRFVDGTDARSRVGELLHVGTVPRSIQYGDPQDFGVNQYTVILERTGPCDPEENSPFRP
mgnify:CR=1 FL=1